MKRHELKTVQPHFGRVASGEKRFDIRKNDRGFAVSDTLVLREYDADTGLFSGRAVEARVTHLISGYDGIEEGYVVMSIELVKELDESQENGPWVEDDHGTLTLTIGRLRAVVAHYSDSDYVWWIDGGERTGPGHGRIEPMSQPVPRSAAKAAAEQMLREIHASLDAHFAPTHVLQWRRFEDIDMTRYEGKLGPLKLRASRRGWTVKGADGNYLFNFCVAVISDVYGDDVIKAHREQCEDSVRAIGAVFRSEIVR